MHLHVENVFAIITIFASKVNEDNKAQAFIIRN